jgi:hypothetical protein
MATAPAQPAPFARVAAWSERTRTVAGGLLLLALSFAAHAPSLQNGFIWDDDQYVVNNPLLHRGDGLLRIWSDVRATDQFYPLVHTSFWLEVQLWGMHPFHFHFFNIALHALAALLLWRFLAYLRLPGAYLAALVFALHPMQVESVAWILERKNVLCGAFCYGALLLLLPVVESADEALTPPRLRRYLAGLLLFAGAMFSKTVACALGPTLLLLVWWRRGPLRPRHLLLVTPTLVLGAGLGLLTAYLERSQVGASGAEWAYSPADRVLIAGRSLFFYLQGYVWPGERVFMPVRFQIDAGEPRQYLYPAAVVLLAGLLWAARKRIGRGPIVALLIFCGTMFPALGFIDIYPMRYALAFDHYAYLASPALIAPLVALAVRALGALPAMVAGGGLMAAVGVLALYASMTWQQSIHYESMESIFRHTLVHNPDSWLAHRHVANAARARGELDEAIVHYREALRIKPGDEASHNNLGIIFSEKGDLRAATRHFERARELRPGFAPTYRNLAIAYSLQGRKEEARAMFERFERLSNRPSAADAASAARDRR